MLWTVRFAALVVAGLLAAGCGPGTAPLKTYPVSGQVLVKGGQPLAGGTVEFRSTADPTIAAIGDIANDGSFALRTLYNGQTWPGAVEGLHDVSVSPARDREHHGAASIRLPRPYTVEAKENRFVIEIEPAQP
jgi:hypothetical protein